MSFITKDPKRMGSLVVTEFVDSVGTDVTTFSIPNNIEQDTLRIYNISPVELLVSVGTQSNVSVPSYRGITLNEVYTSFNIKSTLGVGGFRATCSYEDSDEEDEQILSERIDTLTTSLAQIANLTDHTITYSYYPDGNVQTVTEKDSNNNVVKTVTYNYNASGDVSTSVTVTNGKTVTTTYNYDVNGNVTSTTNVIS